MRFGSVTGFQPCPLPINPEGGVIEQVQPDNTRVCKQAESRVYILSHVDVPAVFAECGFLSNPEEAEKLCDENYQKKLAAAIADGIIAFCKAE